MQIPTNNQGDPKEEIPTEDTKSEITPPQPKPKVVKTSDVGLGVNSTDQKPQKLAPLKVSPQPNVVISQQNTSQLKPPLRVRTPRLTRSPNKIVVRPDFQRKEEPPQKNDTGGAKKISTLKRIRTLGGDTSDFIRKGKLSMTDLFLKQQRQARASGVREIKQAKPFYKKGGFIVGLLILIIFGAGGGYLLWYIKQEPTQVKVYIPTPPKPLLTSQETIIIKTHDLESSAGLKDRLQNLFHKRYDAGDLVFIPIQKETLGGYFFLGSKLFLEAVDANAPTFLTTFLENNFYLGTLVLKKNHPIFILKTQKQQRDNTYAGMLRWEKDMLEDLDFISNKGNISTTTPSVFSDILIKNYSARAIQNEKGTVLMYGFFNREYIIITDDLRAFETVIERFILFEFS